jgi:hypothetical protein
MPYVTGSILPGGVIIDVVIGVSEGRQKVLANVGFPVPARKTIRAVIDTGSGVSGIDPRVLQALDLKPVGDMQINTPSTSHTPHPCGEYLVSLSLLQSNQELHLPTFSVIDAVFQPDENIQALLGRDVLDHCLFIYDGQRQAFALAF